VALLGGDVRSYVPNRIDEGYGLNGDALRSLSERGANLVITADCGIASIEEAKIARELGLEVVITDHHTPLHDVAGPRLPDAAAIVHPRLPGSGCSFGSLCGAGVAFKLAWALCQAASQSKRVSDPMRRFLLEAVGLAAIGTIADVVPLVDENRLIVADGLVRLREMPSPGVAALMKVSGLAEKKCLSSEDVAFSLAPRLNAAGRLGQAQLSVELLTTESETRAAALAEYLDELNNSRTSLERSIYLSATKQMKRFDPEGDPALVLADHDWHPGVIGIVAGRLAEKYHRPVVMIALDKAGAKPGQGSARSVPGYNLHEALAACCEHLLSHGGHAAAAGLKIEEPRVDPFRIDFCEHAAMEIKAEQRIAELLVDAETPLSALSVAAVDQIERLAPFGAGNGRPLLCTSGVTLDEPPKRMGEGGRHVSFRFRQHQTSLRAVAFGQGDWADQLAPGQPLAIAFRPVINEYRGRRSVELHVADWKPASH
jgi:single-stranded-DNA-specific exonuclease